jgi:regulator of sigma E protease
MISIILFILLLTFLILIHELGHLIVALWCKVQVEEFGIGLPPKAKVLFYWNGIPVTFNWLFMGGFVRMNGEEGPGGNSENMVSEGKQAEPLFQPSGKDAFLARILFPPVARLVAGIGIRKRSHGVPFYSLPLLQKIAIVIAGPLVNFVFGVIVFAGIFSVYGIPTKVYEHPILGGVSQQSPAASADLRAGDQILWITSFGRMTVTPVDSNESLITYINAHRGETLHVQILRDGNKKELDIYSRKIEETPEGQGAFGIELKSQYEIRQYPLIERPFRGIIAGLTQSIDFGKTILHSLGTIGRTVAGGNVPKDISGPVGIASQVQKEGVFSNGWTSALNFAALLSINLGVMNILPIPALDGGRIVLLLIEKVVRKKQFQSISYWLNTVGFLFLLSLLVLITLKDVIMIILGK